MAATLKATTTARTAELSKIWRHLDFISGLLSSPTSVSKWKGMNSFCRRKPSDVRCKCSFSTRKNDQIVRRTSSTTIKAVVMSHPAQRSLGGTSVSVQAKRPMKSNTIAA